MATALRCPVCRDKFRYDINKPWPRTCPLCKADINNDRADDDIVMPFVLKGGRTKSIDKVYRDMEKGSEIRAQAAAEMTGATATEMSSLKITNLNDRRDAEIAAILPNNPVSQVMVSNPNVYGFGSGNGLAYSAGVQTGPVPNRGAGIRTAIQMGHREAVAKHAIGINEHGRPAMPNTDVVSERPANEVMQPGYRRRG
jgi:hypothetical protein